MGKVYEGFGERWRAFIEAQKMFFVATAPLQADGHINLSPKGLDGTFAVLDDTTVAYLDLTGSGIETVAHVRENKRICIMFCAFEGPPLIFRIHGEAEVVTSEHADYDNLLQHFAPFDGVRSIIRVKATRISDSCGYGVPVYAYEGQREQLTKWADRKGREAIVEYQRTNNKESLDGLPGI